MPPTTAPGGASGPGAERCGAEPCPPDSAADEAVTGVRTVNTGARRHDDTVVIAGLVAGGAMLATGIGVGVRRRRAAASGSEASTAGTSEP